MRTRERLKIAACSIGLVGGVALGVYGGLNATHESVAGAQSNKDCDKHNVHCDIASQHNNAMGMDDGEAALGAIAVLVAGVYSKPYFEAAGINRIDGEYIDLVKADQS